MISPNHLEDVVRRQRRTLVAEMRSNHRRGAPAARSAKGGGRRRGAGACRGGGRRCAPDRCGRRRSLDGEWGGLVDNRRSRRASTLRDLERDLACDLACDLARDLARGGQYVVRRGVNGDTRGSDPLVGSIADLRELRLDFPRALRIGLRMLGVAEAEIELELARGGGGRLELALDVHGRPGRIRRRRLPFTVSLGGFARGGSLAGICRRVCSRRIAFAPCSYWRNDSRVRAGFAAA